MLAISMANAQQITNIAPPNWFVGMRDSSLQIMIHGTDISKYDLKINYPGVHLIAVTKSGEPELFVC